LAKIYHLNCPNCGGLISSRGERVVECKYCQSRSLVIIPDWTPKYYVKPGLDFSQARRAMVSLFKREEVETGLLKTARFESADLFLAPFYFLRAKRVGVFTSFGQPQTMSAALGGMDYEDLNYRQLVKKQRLMEQTKTDSRVIFNDVERSFPALNLEDWGLNEFEPDKVIVANELELNRYRRDEVEKLGVILEPRLSAKERVEQIFKTPELASVKDNTQVVEQRVELVYYPIWRIRWRYQGKVFQTTIDGVTGKFLFTRVPAKERARVVWLLAVSAAIGLSIGKLLKIPLLILAATGVVGIWFIGIFSILLLFFVAFGWNMFRYSSELIISGDSVSAEFIGRPSETVFDKLALGMSRILEQGFKEAQRRRERSWS